MKSGIYRKVFLAFFCVFFFVFVFGGANWLMNTAKVNRLKFNESQKHALSRTRHLVEASQGFDEKAALERLGKRPENGDFVLFDDNLESARFTAPASVGKLRTGHYGNLCFNFDSDKDLKIRPAAYRVEDGILKYRFTRSNVLQNAEPIEIDRESVGEIELRLKVARATILLFAWSENPEADILDAHKTDYLSIPVVPDNAFHTYRVDVTNVLKGEAFGDTPIRKLFLLPSVTDEDDIEIDSICFRTKQDRYSKRPYGLTYEMKGGETRKSVFMGPPMELTWDVVVPARDPELTFGLGVLLAHAPVRFTLTLRQGEAVKTVFSKEIADPEVWYDASVDLADYAGKHVEVSVSVRGAEPNTFFWTNPALRGASEERFNVMILLEDALRADRIGHYGYTGDTTPVKDRFSTQGVVFENAFSQSTTTRSSLPSLMTSLYPSATGVWRVDERLNDGYLTLAEILRNQGFATASFIQNVNAGAHAGVHQGFGTVYDPERFGPRADSLYDGSILNAWLDRNGDRNFFVYLHLIDPHGPYDPPRERLAEYSGHYKGDLYPVKRDRDFDPTWVKQPTVESRNILYDLEVRNNDLFFARLLENLENRGLLADTLVIILSDHGEHLGENGLWGHRPPGYAQVLHVPLIMICPGRIPEGRKIAAPVQLIDVFPTILDLLEINTDPLLIEGDSLVPLMRGEDPAFWNNRLVLSEEVENKFKHEKITHGSLFFRDFHVLHTEDLRTGAPPEDAFSPQGPYARFLNTRVFRHAVVGAETSQDDLTSFRMDILFNQGVQRFLDEFRTLNLQVWRNVTRSGAETSETRKIDPKAREALRSLGYIQ